MVRERRAWAWAVARSAAWVGVVARTIRVPSSVSWDAVDGGFGIDRTVVSWASWRAGTPCS
ncbi:hypothetical protein ACFQ0B_17775 [Nonomuraea thailandensis]